MISRIPKIQKIKFEVNKALPLKKERQGLYDKIGLPLIQNEIPKEWENIRDVNFL